jgi:hypothetical protein
MRIKRDKDLFFAPFAERGQALPLTLRKLLDEHALVFTKRRYQAGLKARKTS